MTPRIIASTETTPNENAPKTMLKIPRDIDHTAALLVGMGTLPDALRLRAHIVRMKYNPRITTMMTGIANGPTCIVGTADTTALIVIDSPVPKTAPRSGAKEDDVRD